MNNLEIIQKLKEYFKLKKFKGYDPNIEFTVRETNEKLRDDRVRDVYVISFLSIVIHDEQKMLFALMDKETEEFLYIMGPSGYIEV